MAHAGDELRLVLARLLELAALDLDFVEQADILDCDDCLIGKGSDQLDLLVTEWADDPPADRDDTDWLVLAHQRHAQHGAEAATFDRLGPAIVRVNGGVRDVDHSAPSRGSADQRLTTRRYGLLLHPLLVFERKTMACSEAIDIALPPENECEVRLAKPLRRFNQRIEHCLQIEGRAADDLEHVGSRGLLLEGFGEIAGARLDLVEQPHVLDRDHRLVSEGADQLDLFLRERSYLVPCQRDHANRFSLAQQRYPKHGAQAVPLLYFGVRVFRVSQHVGDMNGLSFQNRAPDNASSPPVRNGLEMLLGSRRIAVGGRQMVSLAFLARYDSHIGFAQLGR